MKVLVGISRIFVGILFIISGFVKLSDPKGFSYKLTEYFSEGVLGMEFLQPYTLYLAFFLVIFEIILGVFLILGYRRKFTLTSLLGMIVFFTFLTFYSAYFNKVTDCGCFGDALPLTPWQSFAKDVVLLLFILLLIKGREFLTPFFSSKINFTSSLLAFILSTSYGIYVLQYLPILDFRPYKLGTHIPTAMQIPQDAPKAVFDYHWKFIEDGKEKIITTNGSYPKTKGKFVSVDTQMVQKGYEPPIHDFSIEKDGEDFTTDMLTHPKLLVFVMCNLNTSDLKAFESMSNTLQKARSKGYTCIGLSASAPEDFTSLIKDYSIKLPIYFCDETALKTMIRSNPGVLKLNNGTISQKLHWRSIDQLVFD